MAFWDTSALIKLYVRERDSGIFREMMRTLVEPPVISQLTLAEIHRVFWAKELARAIPANRAEATYATFRKDVEAASFDIVPFERRVEHEFDRIVLACYRASPAVPIRTLDGLLLASALVARTSELVSTDSRMRSAGALLGLRLLPD